MKPGHVKRQCPASEQRENVQEREQVVVEHKVTEPKSPEGDKANLDSRSEEEISASPVFENRKSLNVDSDDSTDVIESGVKNRF